MLPLMPDLFGGRQLGKYEVLCRLSTGGMAEIFLASQRGAAGFRKLVVLKQILPDIRGEEEFVRMFLDEAKVTAAFNHPNIAQVFDLDIAEGELFLAMEFVPGATLVEVAKAARTAVGGIPIGFSLAAVRDTAVALHYAHTFKDPLGRASPVIHRDIAEKNIMVTYEGVTKLLDFGIAKSLARTSRTQVGTVKGTSGYMSPEQILGEPLDARSDLFSLGVVLHECLTGMRLFYGRTPDAAMNAVLQGEVPPPSRANKAVPPEVDAIVLKALAKRREERYATTLEFARALDRAVGPLIWHPEQSGELMQQLFEARREQTRGLLAAGQMGSAEATGEIRLSQLFGGTNPFAPPAPAEPAAPPPAAAPPPPAPASPPLPSNTPTAETQAPPLAQGRTPTLTRGAPRRAQASVPAPPPVPEEPVAAPPTPRRARPAPPPPETVEETTPVGPPPSPPPGPRRTTGPAHQALPPTPPPAEDSTGVLPRRPGGETPRRAAPPPPDAARPPPPPESTVTSVPEPSRTSRTESTARTVVPSPEERPEPRSRDPLSQPRAPAPRSRHPVGPPADDEVTVPQASTSRRVRAPAPPPRDMGEDSVTGPTARQDALPFRADEATELTVPGMRPRVPTTEAAGPAEPPTHVVPAGKPAPAPRGKGLLYGLGVLGVVALLLALVALRLDGGLISSELPTLSELLTPSDHNPGDLQPLPEPGGDAPAPPPLERPLNPAKDPVPGASQTQAAPTPSQPAAPTASPTAAAPPARPEDELLAPLEPAPEKPTTAAKPGTGTPVAEAPAAPAEDSGTAKRTRTPLKKGARAPATAPAEEPVEAASPKQAQGEPGQLTLVIEPFAKVYLGGRLLGETPLFKVNLPSGRHSLRLVGPDGQARRLSVEIKPGDTTSLRMPLELLARE